MAVYCKKKNAQERRRNEGEEKEGRSSGHKLDITDDITN